MTEPVRLNGRDVKPYKATVAPALGTRTVLNQAPWDFVDLWLRRQQPHSQSANARFFWGQARTFAKGAHALPVESAPLLHYYSFMNAAKALLASKQLVFAEHHGVRAHNMGQVSGQIVLATEGVAIMPKGVLPSLSTYLGELELSTTHSMAELLFNLPCIHRTYCLTYLGLTDLFIPLTDCRFVFDPATSKVHFAAELSRDFDDAATIARLPASLVAAGGRVLRSVAANAVSGATLTTADDFEALVSLNKQLRPDLHYLNGAQTLWYAKAATAVGPKRLQRSPLTLTLAAMHRLSELCRYKPKELSAFFDGPENWLLSEFIQMAPSQFLDEIAAEITGHQIMLPNVRPAT
jgi:hypothetical protein